MRSLKQRGSIGDEAVRGSNRAPAVGKSTKYPQARKAGVLIAVLAVIAATVLFIQAPGDAEISTQDQVGEIRLGTKVGEKLPDFTLKTLDGGKPVSLSDFTGKPVVVNFWASWCPFCVEELPDFETIGEELGDQVVIISINRAESIQTQKRGLAEYEETNDIKFMKILFLDDPTDSLGQRFGVSVMPTTFFLDSEGVIADKKFGQVFPDEMKERLAKAGVSMVLVPESLENALFTEVPR
ncbi:MAG: TlpA family protein disulfide reductase [Candidatus Bathyarchaeia archaeon]